VEWCGVNVPALVRDSKHQALINKRLPELVTLERLLKSIQDRAKVKVEATVSHAGIEFPIYSITMGSEDKSAPCLGIFGGVHGLERIGSEVVIAWLQSISELMNWDDTFRERLKHTRLVFMPIVNPVGMFLTRRSNGNHVDLMRNSPVIADEPPVYLVGGQTISPKLPWYRGNTTSEATMEIESRAMCQLVEREIFPSRLAVTVDVHSGFGTVDRLWFPYAKSKRPPPHLVEIVALKRIFDRSYPNHIYKIEPQSKSYTTHGDLWDWMYDRSFEEAKGSLFLPWTLELGSWLWLKKNPRQLFSSLGAFNPIQPHRLRRILRRHITLFDFLHRSIMSSESWAKPDEETRLHLQRRAMDLWYDAKI
jgi:hypothetical protein